MSSLGKDLETIRTKLNLSLEDVYDVTRIPVHIIKSIEDETLFGGVETNKTYIRSFVRSYAKGLKITEEDIIEALNQMDQNRYEGFLAEKYSGIESPGSTSETKSTSKEPEETGTSEEHKSKPLNVEKEKITHGEVTPYSQPDPSRNHNQPTPPPPSVSSINWAAIGKKFYQFNVKSRVWVVVVFLLLAVAVIGFFFFYNPQNIEQSSTVLDTTAILNNQATSDTQSAMPTEETLDTTISEDASAVTEDENNQEQENAGTGSQISLPDTLRLVIYAAHNKLEPVRVNSDVNERLSPYWIDQGQAMRFEFVDTLELRGQYSRMELLFNGHLVEDAYPNYYVQDQNRVIITRSIFESDEKWQNPISPDTLAGNIPPPRVIKDRPTF